MHQQSIERFEEICELIKNVDANGDAIIQTHQFRTVNEKFRANVKEEKQLSEIFDMLNARSLEDEKFIYSFTAVITSRQFDSFLVNGKNLRHAMLSILQKNFQNADNFKRDNMEKFYNSIKLLGEYYNKARLSNGFPINIIGQSLLNLINVELEKELRNICHLKNEYFAKLVLSQISLNGNLLKTRQKKEIEQVFFTIRKCLIEIDSLTPKNKAFLIMTLDLYYNNFSNIGDALEKMYETFLVEDIKSVSRTASNSNVNAVKVTEKENGKVQASLERTSITKKSEERRKSTESVRSKVQTKKTEPAKKEPAPPSTSTARPSTRTSQPNRIVRHYPSYRSVSQSRTIPKPPQPPPSRSLSQTPTQRRAPQPARKRDPAARSTSLTPSTRRAPQPTPRNVTNVTNRSSSQSTPAKSRYVISSTRNRQQPVTNQRSQETPKKKPSPQDLRSRNSPTVTNGYNGSSDQSSKSEDSAIEKTDEPSTNSHDNESGPPTSSDSPLSNPADDNVLRQQNSRSSTPSSTAAPSKYKSSNKVYFREENVENLTWNGETSFEGDPDDPDESTSPKVNPYSSSFLNFLKTN